MRNPIVALVGRPNVGKSTLFNRLLGERLAVVDDTPGTTRDRLVAETEWNGVSFDLVDTGGIESRIRPADAPPLAINSADFIAEIRAQSEMAIAAADVIVFLTDVQAGVTAADLEAADILRRRQTVVDGVRRPPVLLAVNKGDNAALRDQAYQFYELGLGDPIPIAALHGIGTGDLLDAIVAALPPVPHGTADSRDEADEAVRIAIVGRPNVGKSSLLNKLLGEERAIVSPVPGTTRDAIDTHLIYDGLPITLIDTAGIRRRGRIERGVEKYSVLRALRAIDRAEVALLVVDATEPVTAQDAHIAGFIIDKMRSVVVVVNKWDAIEKDTYTMDDFRHRVQHALRFLDYVPVLFVSALTGQRVNQILPTALRVQEERLVRIPTAALNKLIRRAVGRHPPPSRAGRRLKILYAAQVATAPPKFLLHVNDHRLVHFTYVRYLENQIRGEYGFLGTPLRLSFRERHE